MFALGLIKMLLNSLFYNFLYFIVIILTYNNNWCVHFVSCMQQKADDNGVTRFVCMAVFFVTDCMCPRQAGP